MESDPHLPHSTQGKAITIAKDWEHSLPAQQTADEMTRDIETYARQLGRGYVGLRLKEYAAELKLNIGEPKFHGDVLYADEVERFLSASLRELESSSRKKARVFTAIEWLFYLRRLPRELLAGDLSTTGTYDLLLAEMLANTYGASPDLRILRTQGSTLQFPVDKRIVQQVLDLCAFAVFLSQVHTNLRWYGKRVGFKAGDLVIPTPAPTCREHALVRRYDRRVADIGKSLDLIQMAGTVIAERVSQEDAQERKFDLALVYAVPEMALSPTLGMMARFMPQCYSLAPLRQLNSAVKDAWWHPDTGHLLTLLRISAAALKELSPLKSLLLYGYLPLSVEWIESFMQSFAEKNADELGMILPDAAFPFSTSELKTAMKRFKGSLWPLVPGGIIHELDDRLDNKWIIDVHKASSLLRHVLEFPKVDNALAAERSQHFELATQKVVNQSKWKPGPDLARWRGIQLTRGGAWFTDFDAVGESGDTLLIIDCFSRVYDSVYDSGNRNRVSDAAEKIDLKLSNWQTKREELLADPKLDQDNFSRYKEVIALVCTPFPYYVPSVRSARKVNGIRVVCTLPELQEWLNR